MFCVHVTLRTVNQILQSDGFNEVHPSLGLGKSGSERNGAGWSYDSAALLRAI